MVLSHAPQPNASCVARVVLEIDRSAAVWIGHLGRKRRAKRSLKFRLDQDIDTMEPEHKDANMILNSNTKKIEKVTEIVKSQKDLLGQRDKMVDMLTNSLSEIERKIEHLVAN